MVNFRRINSVKMTEDWSNENPKEEVAPAPVISEIPEVKLFGKWSCEDVQVPDMSLQDYIAAKDKFAKFIPHSADREDSRSSTC